MLKHLAQLMKFKTAMDVRIGLPNEHLAGVARDEINQPMYATAVGLVMRGFEYLDTYKKSFNAGHEDDFTKNAHRQTATEKNEKENFVSHEEGPQEARTSLGEKIKIMMSKMFEVEDQSIN